jgi:hypothetical protein
VRTAAPAAHSRHLDGMDADPDQVDIISDHQPEPGAGKDKDILDPEGMFI